MAQERVPFQGLPARICWLGYGERARAGLRFNELVASGEVSAPIVIGRDHLDSGSVASPNRETEAMRDGSDAIADWPLLNALVNTSAGASWVSIHHGGGTGIGYSQHAGHGRRRRRHAARGAEARAGPDDRSGHGRDSPRRRRLRAGDRGRPRARRAHPDAHGTLSTRTAVPFDPEAPLAGAPDPWLPSAIPAARSGPPWAMTEMIAAEPALAERIVRRLAEDSALAELVAAVSGAQRAGEPITLIGCGTSEHAAQAIAAMWRAAGVDARHAQALETLAQPQRDGVVVAISHEGGTAATNEALRAARDAGARTALISAGGGSPGALIAELTVATGEQDMSWCHTVGYLSPLIAGATVAQRIVGASPEVGAIRALLRAATDESGAEAIAARLAECDRLIVAGSGPDHASARELALKVAEGSHLPAQALHLETMLHGHLAAEGSGTAFVLVLTDAPAFVVERARRVLRATMALGMPSAAILGAAVAADIQSELTPAGRLLVPASGALEPEAAAVLGAAIPLQLIAERLARARGVNPDDLGRADPAQAAAHDQ